MKRLIDLSRRNNLLFYRDLPSGTLDLSGASPDAIQALLPIRFTSHHRRTSSNKVLSAVQQQTAAAG